MRFNTEKLLFFDIETVSQYQNVSELPKEKLKIWESYFNTFRGKVTDESRIPKEEDYKGRLDNLYKEDLHNEVYRQTAAFFPEFGKVACVSLGFVKNNVPKFESFYGKDEVEILKKIRDVFNKVEPMDFILCGQNIKNFDIPFLTKRYIIHGLKIPTIFPNYDTKPWEMKVLDTKEVWSSGAKYGLSSLDLICMSLNIESPKNGDVKGDNVNTNFWVDNHEEIKEYCEKDVKALIDIITKFNSLK